MQREKEINLHKHFECFNSYLYAFLDAGLGSNLRKMIHMGVFVQKVLFHTTDGTINPGTLWKGLQGCHRGKRKKKTLIDSSNRFTIISQSCEPKINAYSEIYNTTKKVTIMYLIILNVALRSGKMLASCSSKAKCCGHICWLCWSHAHWGKGAAPFNSST